MSYYRCPECYQTDSEPSLIHHTIYCRFDELYSPEYEYIDCNSSITRTLKNILEDAKEKEGDIWEENWNESYGV